MCQSQRGNRVRLRNSVARLIALVSVLVLAGCALPRGAALQSEVLDTSGTATTGPFQVVQVTRPMLPRLALWPGTFEPPTNWPSFGTAGAEPVIRVGDRLDVTVWDSQENSLLTTPGQRFTVIENVEVDESGTIFLPYVEQVEIAGLTPVAARARIQQRLEPIVPSAQVQLGQSQGRDHAVDVLGAVGAPGAYPLRSRDYRVLSLLADAGGIPTGLRNPQVRLLRGASTFTIPAERLLESAANNTRLRPRDTVIVEEDSRSFVALGAATTQDLIYFPKSRVSALEAVSLMGGLSDSRADPGGVLILREFPARALAAGDAGPDARQVVFTLDLTSADGLFAAGQFPIQPDDALLVTESPITSAVTVLSLIGAALGISAQVNVLTR